MKSTRTFVFTIVFLSFASALILFLMRSTDQKGEYSGNEGVVLQSKRNNCGPSALKMILDHHHIPSSVEEIERLVDLRENGSSMLALKRTAISKGLKTDGWKLSFEDFSLRPFPSLVYIRNDHFAVADSVVGDTIFIRDPAVGRLKMKKRKFLHVWRGETLIFSKN